MKTGWRSIFAVIVAGSLLLISGVPSDAGRRVARGSSYDGTWSVAIYTLRGDCGSLRAALRIIGGRVSSGGRKLPSLRCRWSRGRNPRNSHQRQPVGVRFRPTVI
jgi:hypothetical protein